MEMKKWVTAFGLGTLVLMGSLSGAAANTVPLPVVTTQPAAINSYAAYRLIVSGKAVDTSDLPAPVHNKEGVVMVPLRRTAESLGYTVTWDEAAQRTRVDMSIAYMDFAPAMKDYERIGKLKHININYLYDFGAPPELIEGVLYVPADVFTAFYNDVSVEGNAVSILPQVSYTLMGGPA